MSLLKTLKATRLSVKVFDNRLSLGRDAGAEVAAKMREILRAKGRVRIIFAAAPSQNECLQTLSAAEGIDRSKVTAFHMDEYIGLPEDAPQRFAHYLEKHILDAVKPGTVHFIDGRDHLEEECRRYASLILEEPIDIVCLGIGENGHIAFNDPPVADFQDKNIIKKVMLDEPCRI